LGDHIRKKRIELGLLKREVADLFGAHPQSVNAWERNYHQPALYRLEAITAFLGYDPENVSDDAPLGLRIASKGRRLGFSQRALAERLGIDEGTARKWERGEIFVRADERVRRILQGWGQLRRLIPAVRTRRNARLTSASSRRPPDSEQR
jgi:transcriptional regulator with XRE-family HTH domain